MIKLPDLKITLLTMICLMAAVTGFTQTKTVKGVVTDQKGRPVVPATVFFNGTQKIGTTNDKGEFSFSGMEPGAYQLVVKMLGLGTITKDITLQETDLDLKISMAPQAIELKEVVIGGGGEDLFKDIRFNLFKENFLGTSANAMDCKIINPEVLTLKENKRTGTHTASSDDFLIIENSRLGYRIKYLLKSYEYKSIGKTTSYSGNTIFEEMPGTDKMKQKWAENRERTYRGSLMHFFRSVYAGSDVSIKEGFLSQSIVKQKSTTLNDGIRYDVILTTIIDPRPVGFDTLVNMVDGAFVSLKFKNGLAVTYDPKKAAKVSATETKAGTTEKVEVGKRTSTLHLGQQEVLIDSRGSITNFPALLIKGWWGERRIGDQLPYEYKPDRTIE